MKSHEVVIHEVQAQHVDMICRFPAERIGEAYEAVCPLRMLRFCHSTCEVEMSTSTRLNESGVV